ncbi:hypothetical protein [Halohasta litorea]|uniref:DUF7999 domain-containing protein n=1 Tax=Halohasta litorea TaxID=869891 RepID=A0ABD6D668_9EURY|nr:hypothetical protein [Halohasta litorea]MEA1932187.1 hypothetical protein [Euryarchaeota archaeon]
MTVEQNRYGAMTLRSAADRTYQVVGSESPAVEETLARLTAGSEVSVTLTRAHGRGDGWYVAAVDAPEVARPAIHERTGTTDRPEPSFRRESR